jgi:enhancing lycopene biosynthesis protein 2
MANVFIEPRPKGHHEHSPIEDYVVEDQANHVLHTSETQAEAIAWARAQGYTPLVARVRDLSDKKKRDHWRAP